MIPHVRADRLRSSCNVGTGDCGRITEKSEISYRVNRQNAKAENKSKQNPKISVAKCSVKSAENLSRVEVAPENDERQVHRGVCECNSEGKPAPFGHLQSDHGENHHEHARVQSDTDSP